MNQNFHHLARGIMVAEGKVLLAQARGYSNTFLPGGHIEFGESAKDALKREIEEELGIDCEVGNFLGLVEHKWEKKGQLNCEINQVFEVKARNLQPNTNPESIEDHLTFYWCSWEQLDKQNLQPYPFRNLISNYMKGSEDIWWESTLPFPINHSNRN